METKAIQPALTPEEWADGYTLDGELSIESGRIEVSSTYYEKSRSGAPPAVIRAVAAVALSFAGPDGGPMFTRAMLEALESCVSAAAHEWGEDETTELADHALARLASLLPPEQP